MYEPFEVDAYNLSGKVKQRALAFYEGKEDKINMLVHVNDTSVFITKEQAMKFFGLTDLTPVYRAIDQGKEESNKE